MSEAEQAQAMGKQRRGGRAGKRSDAAGSFEQPAFSQPRLPFPPTEFVSADELEAIHNASLEVLEDIGIDFIHDGAKQILKQAGVTLTPGSDRVRFDRGFVLDAIKTCPPQFRMRARNPLHDIQVGGNNMFFTMMASAPNCSDADNGRRPGNRQDFQNLLKLNQMHNVLHAVGGYPVEPVDLHAGIRHLECLADTVSMTDKVFSIYSLGKERNLDGMEIARIARGVSHEQFAREPSVFTIINSSSPLRLDTPMLEGIIQMSSRGQVIVLTPFTLAGAMAPVTIAGALVQQNAEALAGLAFAQTVKPGAPCIYGGFTSNVDMKSGAPAFGTPEYMKAQLVGGQLARRYQIPYRTSNVCAANTTDAQAAYESVFSLWGAVTAGGHHIKHAAGWLEGGLTCSYEKTIIDVDLLQMVSEFLTPLDLSPDGLALDAIREVGPGGHYFGTEQTQARFRDAFYAPVISDWRNFETWAEAGSPTATEKANQVWKQRLREYQPPPIDPAAAEELKSFVERRVGEGGVPTDF